MCVYGCRILFNPKYSLALTYTYMYLYTTMLQVVNTEETKRKILNTIELVLRSVVFRAVQ